MTNSNAPAEPAASDDAKGKSTGDKAPSRNAVNQDDDEGKVAKSPRFATILSSLLLIALLALVFGQAMALTGSDGFSYAVCSVTFPSNELAAILGAIGALCIFLMALEFLIRENRGISSTLISYAFILGFILVAATAYSNMAELSNHAGAARMPDYVDGYDCIPKGEARGAWTEETKDFFHIAVTFNQWVLAWSLLALAILVGSKMARGVLLAFIVFLREKLPW